MMHLFCQVWIIHIYYDRVMEFTLFHDWRSPSILVWVIEV